jgi:ATP-dependent Clp protease ATP-binding subunit ClpC
MPALLFLADFLSLPSWWFVAFPLFFLKLAKKLVIYLDQTLAASLMLRTLFVPLFGDTSLFGFLFGFVFRSLRVFVGFFLIVLVSFLLLIFFGGWLLLPLFLFLEATSLLRPLTFFLVLAFWRALGLSFSRWQAQRTRKRWEGEAFWRLEVPAGEKPKEEDRQAVLAWLEKRWAWEHPPFLWEDRYVLGPLGGVNRAWTGRVTPRLDAYSLDLTAEAQRGRLPPLLGKEKPLAALVRALEKESNNNVLLVGPAGCGKTTLIFGLAQEIIRGTYSPALSSKRLVSLEMGALVAGTKSEGELQERMQQILRDIEASRNVLLFIDEVHNAVAAGGGIDTSLIFSALEPHLAAGRVQMIGATSWGNYRRYIEPNEAFARLFNVVAMEEASFTETLQILEYLSQSLERKYRLFLSYPALRQAIELASRFIYERALPDKAVSLLEETVVYASRYKKVGELLTAADVAKLITEKTHIPVTAVGKEEAAQLLRLEERMHERLIGQDEAIKAIADAIRRARVGLRDPKRPIASLLFVGPTGVGKTEASKALAEVFFGNEENLLSFDMSEYQREDSVNRLIGAPAGPGQAVSLGLLTEKVRQNPFSLILFDEVDKAHARVLDLFLQVLEEGRLTDAAGNRVNFANAILIFTSNAGTNLIYQYLREGKPLADLHKDLFSFLQNNFRVELLNRFDGVVVFSPLTLPQVAQIVRLKLNKIVKVMKEKKITISYSDALVESLAKLGFDPALGARPLRRLLQDKVESYLARKLLAGEIRGGQTLSLGTEVLAPR